MTEWRSLSRANFKKWHAQYKADNGYPLPGRNALTGELQPPGVGETTEYVVPVEVSATDVRVAFEDDVLIKPGKASWAPTYKDDGTIDVAKSKTEPAPKPAEDVQI